MARQLVFSRSGWPVTLVRRRVRLGRIKNNDPAGS